MTPQEILKRIEELQMELNSLKQSATIPIEIDRSFMARGFVKTNPVGIPDPAGNYTTNIGFRRDIDISGSAETITVPAYPVRFLKLNDGSNLYIPLHTYAEFPF